MFFHIEKFLYDKLEKYNACPNEQGREAIVKVTKERYKTKQYIKQRNWFRVDKREECKEYEYLFQFVQDNDHIDCTIRILGNLDHYYKPINAIVEVHGDIWRSISNVEHINLDSGGCFLWYVRLFRFLPETWRW